MLQQYRWKKIWSFAAVLCKSLVATVTRSLLWGTTSLWRLSEHCRSTHSSAEIPEIGFFQWPQMIQLSANLIILFLWPRLIIGAVSNKAVSMICSVQVYHHCASTPVAFIPPNLELKSGATSPLLLDWSSPILGYFTPLGGNFVKGVV